MTRIGFMGRTKMLYETIQMFLQLEGFEVAFIWTCKDEKYYKFGSDNFQSLANMIGVKYINTSHVSSVSNDIDADVVISINFINIIPQSFISKFKYGVINAHAGDLPRYRGNACPNWAILNQEDFVCLSFHLMDAELDSGPIIMKQKFKLKENTYIGEVYKWLENSIPNGFVKSVDRLLLNMPLEVQSGRALRTFPRKPQDSRLDFDSCIDWNYRLIRASSRPFSGAYAYLNDSDVKVVIYKAEKHFVDYDFNAINGQIMDRTKADSSFLLAIGSDVLKVTDYSVNNLSIYESFNIVCASLRNRLT